MECFQIRTDLALEARESIQKGAASIQGVRVEEYEQEKYELKVTKVYIEGKNASKKMGKPMGKYITMEAPTMSEPDEGYHQEISECISRELKEVLCEIEKKTKMSGDDKTNKAKTMGKKNEDDPSMVILIVGLGNRQITADALGPLVVDNLLINRHLIKEFGRHATLHAGGKSICSLEPGVMAKTGMETAEIIEGVVKQIKPDVLIVVDALAARSLRRLNRTIQITDTGIWPGSGVGNHRNAIDKETLGIPVIAIGVPTVVDSATIVLDALEKILVEKEGRDWLGEMDRHRHILPELNNMYMTGKDIDTLVKRVSYTISEGINRALSGE